MSRCLVPAPVILAAAVMLGCGGDADPSPRATTTEPAGPCLVLENGNRVCGEDARTYCEDFVSPDPENAPPSLVRECGALGVDVRPADEQEAERAGNQLAGALRETVEQVAEVQAVEYVTEANIFQVATARPLTGRDYSKLCRLINDGFPRPNPSTAIMLAGPGQQPREPC